MLGLLRGLQREEQTKGINKQPFHDDITTLFRHLYDESTTFMIGLADGDDRVVFVDGIYREPFAVLREHVGNGTDGAAHNKIDFAQ